ncbi:hypothetical protein DMN91_010005 [Ooceraea biroi]|uniref:Odorant receptor n=1 Tax=Ooceraea biroi TaxID=2015173 RepID=A0A026VZQ7_OOCBI|nr:uncharacterized protein LOC105285097 isoform X2 [Ooceraea biroi]EZA48941.1 hypothetical protein X777_12904 [Ooceraea biroi]RLU17768.1 hypothetical protein DMN91_010005 [Ooceraea biroi]
MYDIEERYYKLNHNFIKMLGLWPCQKTYFARIQKILFIGILCGYIIAQLLSFLTMQFSVNLLLKVLSFVFPTLFVTIKYCTFIIQADNVKHLVEQIRYDWKLVKGKLEIDIIKKYADNVRFITMIAIVCCHCGILCYITLQLLPLILNVIAPLNESRSLKLIAVTEYFLNREKYIWVMLLHEIIAVYLRMVTLCSTIMAIMMYILHACALFKVASYRMENAIQEDVLAIRNPLKEYLLYQRIVHVVLIHRRAIGYIELWISSFTVPFTILILIGVSSLSVNLFHLLQLIIVTDDVNEMYAVFMSVILHFSYMFIINYGGEIVQNHGMQVFEATYNGLWYAAPPRTQKLVLFIMQRAIVKINLTCGNIFVASLEGFLTLASTAVSYFTVIYSTR